MPTYSEEFYNDLFSNKNDKRDSEAGLESTCDHAGDDIEDDEQGRHIPEFNRKELMIAIDRLKKREISGQQGNQCRRCQRVDEETITTIHGIFNLIINTKFHGSQLMEKAMITVI